MASASLAIALIVSTWYSPMASSATCTTPWRTDLTSKMNYVLCDTSTESIFNTISDNNNNNKIYDAADNIIIANEFFDDFHTTYNSSMHFDVSKFQGDSSVRECCMSANAFVSDRTHSIAVKVSNALESLRSYVHRLQYALFSVYSHARRYILSGKRECNG